MLKRLRLKRFKNFEDAELSMGPFTLLVGANAAGKSNIGEALPFLHGVGREYTLAEIFGGKWSAGERQWEGLRGGIAEASFRKGERFGIEVDMLLSSDSGHCPGTDYTGTFHIDVATGQRPKVLDELLGSPDDENGEPIYERNLQRPSENPDYVRIRVADACHHDDIDDEDDIDRVDDGGDGNNKSLDVDLFRADKPIISQMGRGRHKRFLRDDCAVGDTLAALTAMRFPRLSPEAMRQPSVPGQRVLSERGENLSSVLQTLCDHKDTKAELIHWVRALTPMDVADLQFPADIRGQVLLVLVEKDGTSLSAYSASEGTLRFLGMLATLLSRDHGVVFLEEIENGLHPSRLRLLVDLIRSRMNTVQIIATTHSPTLLALLDEEMLQHASIIYRLEGESSARITRLLDIPDAARIMASHDRADLLASGWFEDMVEFAATAQ